MSKMSGVVGSTVDITLQGATDNDWDERFKQTFAKLHKHSKNRDGFWYLLSPYSRYPHGQQAAWRHVTRIAASLQSTGFIVFSPIVHFHPMSVAVRTIPSNNDYWMAVNRHFMDPAIGGILAELPGWEESDGVSREIAYLSKAGKPLVRMPVRLDQLD
jgi:hypothetical protein